MNWLNHVNRTMPSLPIYDFKVHIQKSSLKDVSVIAGIDFGSTLTKLAFIEKGTNLKADYIPMRCITYLCEDFLYGLLEMKAQADLPVSGTIHCTGSRCEIVKETIERSLNLKVLPIPERIANRRGLFLSLKFVKSEDLFFPTPSYKTWHYSSKFFDDVCQGESPTRNIADLLPAGVVSIGSAGSVFLLDTSGKSKSLGFVPLGGKAFMGLANILLGTRSYEEIVILATMGRRENVDSQFRDIIGTKDTMYGEVPASLPVFPFGKACHKDWDPKNASRADMAASLLAFFASGLMMTMMNISLSTGVKHFFVCGNFIQSEFIRSLIMESGTIIKSDFKVTFVSLGHCGSLGAMLSDVEDTYEKWIISDFHG